MKKTLMAAMMAMVVGMAAYGAGPGFTDENKDGICDGYVSRGNKTAVEAGEPGKGQYRFADSGVQRHAEGKHMRREAAPGKGRNRQ